MKKVDFAELKAAVRGMVAVINKAKMPEEAGARVKTVPAGIRAGLSMSPGGIRRPARRERAHRLPPASSLC